jgi:pimeloyl-ACP methyl ester carboxylesterase
MRAAWAYFKAIPKTAQEFAALAQRSIAMPVLVLAGEKAAGAGLSAQVSLVAAHVSSTVVPGSGHWLVDERPEETLAALEAFVDASAP